MELDKKTGDAVLNSVTFGVVTFPAVFGYEKGQEISVVFPDLGVATCGENNDDALSSARECLELVLRGLKEDRVEVPHSSKAEDVLTSENECVVDVSVIVER